MKLKKKTKRTIKKALSQLNLYKPKNKTTQKKPFEEVGTNWNSSEKPIAFMFGFNPWKREHISHFFPEYRTAFVFGSADLYRLSPYFSKNKNHMVFIVWGYKEPDEIREYAKKKKIKLIRTEDGFVRSVDLGAGHSLPMSIVIDEKYLYFHSKEPSELEMILQTYDFQSHPDLLSRATANMERLIELGVSKYNHVGPADIDKIYGKKTKKRILVIGQVEEDASIKYGCDREITNNDLVWEAYRENPDAEIIYKPHPDVLNGHRNMVSDPMAVSHISKVVTEPLSLVDSLKTIDHVYTITSLSGFEALIRGIPVTCFGLPFYAGWGLTDDRQQNNRRTRNLTIEELFAGAYLLYPRYISLQTNELIDCEQAIDELTEQIKLERPKDEQENIQKLAEGTKKMKKKPFEEVGVNWEKSDKPIAFMFGFNPWKREHIKHFFPEFRTAFVFGSATLKRLKPYFENENIVFIVWGYKEPDEIREYAEEKGIKLIRTEDGFVRSVDLGAGHSLPMSIVADKQGLYFNSQEPSELEMILQTYDFKKHPELIEKAKANIEKLIHTRVSKYNHVGPINVKKIYGEKTKKRILVIGQVEEDASIKYGCDREITNNDLVWAAYNENPDAEIIYKPHPDVLTGHRDIVSNPKDVAHIAKVVTEPLSLVDALQTIDHVYTITSLSGFEALMRGIDVTCFGMPFYAGWGLTDDRQKNTRRTRKLTIEELFAGAYLLYPKYMSLETNELVDCEEAINELVEKIKSIRAQEEEVFKEKLLEKRKKMKKPYEEVGGNWKDTDKPIAFMFGFNPWKREHMSHFFPEYRTAFVFGKADLDKLLPFMIDKTDFVFIVWGFKELDEIREYAEEKGIKLLRAEDGFVRSLGLGAGHNLPMSIVADEKTLYFDSRGPSQLEHILQTYDFESDPELIETAKRNMEKLIYTGISKYNHVGPTDIEKIYGKKTKKRILVIGQVEEDASIKYGCNREITNNDLVWAAYRENPDAEIIYKPHPDVLTGHRNMVSDPMAVSHISKVVTDPLSLVDSLKTIDHVYTITSLSGFEALIRGISVTCFGSPFYAGWGLTDDRQKNDRRTRKLTIEQLFAGAYLLYPRYISLETNKLIDCEQTIDELLLSKINHMMSEVDESRNEIAIADLETLINKAIELEVNVQDHYLKLAQLSEFKHDYDRSIDYYKDVLQMTKDYAMKANVCYKIADVNIKSGNRSSEETKAYLYEAINMTNDHHFQILLTKYVWENEGLTKECLNLAGRLERKVAGLSAEELMLLAAIKNDAGFYNQALGFVERAIMLDSEIVNQIRYLSLTSMVYERRPDLIEGSDMENFNYRKLKEFAGTFEQMVRDANGDICIVGNHASIADIGKGEWVNNRKLVIRLDNYSIEYPKSLDYGTKTNVWMKEPNYDKCGRRNVNQFDLVLINGANLEHTNQSGMDLIVDFIDAGKPVQTAPHQIYIELVKKLNAKPSTEMLILYWIYKIQGPINSENILGYTCDNPKERSVLKNILKEENLQLA
ncbi:capsular polysaccharide biosynthesis protein [Bacillus timonensis]|nr:capsular polysaccharide biosynthesis protein [Bacillus timonensis]